MDSTYFNIKYIFLGLISALLLLTACEKEEELTGPDRLFRPVQKGLMESQGNWISASWQKNKGAVAYKVEISRDTFKTIDYSVEVDTNAIVFEDLLWDQLYQIQVQALAQDPSKNSGLSFLGEMKTAKFPTILVTPTSNDVTDVAAIVRWTNSGDAVTSIKVLNAADSSLVSEVALTADDIAAQQKVVTGLTGATGYIIYLYSGETMRGWENYTTKVPLVFPNSNIIDLRGIKDNPEALYEALQTAPSGSVIILERGLTYNIPSTTSLNGSVTILSGLGFDDIASIKFSSNFDLSEGAAIDSVKFSNVSMRGDFGGGYVMNISKGGTVGKVIFNACQIQSFRGVARIKSSSPVLISDFTYQNCVIDSINGYGVLNVDNTAAMVENITIRNSTIYKAQNVLVSKSASNSVLIENCTFNEAPLSGNYFVNYNSNDVASLIKIYNCIIGPGWAKPGETSTGVKGIVAGASTSIDLKGTYSTSDYSNISDPLPNLISYDKASTYLFADPANGNFTLVDRTFGGYNSAGDPRWRP
ncbi:DUF5123 domain-containing protein [Pontibacter sp. 172403-2]|uniref:DUF5123 domain-containing protein n=1 Tax=Pontibacter rufus TaxID=2791028 RepID=UPI0018AFDF11|nr:DUF5123 domain-containing protein [Pontibacter sp. 172403-2]MBF9255058.1 DUF5123 domain-containing protein [Pontibacter sp. 172403-2]